MKVFRVILSLVVLLTTALFLMDMPVKTQAQSSSGDCGTCGYGPYSVTHYDYVYQNWECPKKGSFWDGCDESGETQVSATANGGLECTSSYHPDTVSKRCHDHEQCSPCGRERNDWWSSCYSTSGVIKVCANCNSKDESDYTRNKTSGLGCDLQATVEEVESCSSCPDDDDEEEEEENESPCGTVSCDCDPCPDIVENSCVCEQQNLCGTDPCYCYSCDGDSCTCHEPVCGYDNCTCAQACPGSGCSCASACDHHTDCDCSGCSGGSCSCGS